MTPVFAACEKFDPSWGDSGNSGSSDYFFGVGIGKVLTLQCVLGMVQG